MSAAEMDAMGGIAQGVGARSSRVSSEETGRRSSLPPGPDLPPTRQAARWAMRQLEFLSEARQRYGDVFTVRLAGGEPLVVVGDHELVRDVISAPADVLRAGEGNRPVLGPLLGDRSLFLLDGESHMSRRRLMLPAFHARRLEGYARTMATLAATHLDAWPRGEAVASLPRMRGLALEVISRTVFGPVEEDRRAPLHDALFALRLPLNFGEGDSPAYRAAIDRAEALVDEEVARRRAGDAPGEDDVLSMLLEARFEDGSPLSAADLRAQLMTLIMAGAETTGSGLAWALERLARSPEALARAIADAGKGDGPDRGGGPYIEATVYETLRMRPPLPTFGRFAMQPFALGDRTIPAGTRIAPSVLLVHHDPRVYPDPLRFRPERFLDSRPGTYTWLPFGGGVRRCIGAGFAVLEMRIVLAALLARMAPRAVEPEPEPMRNRTTITLPAHEATVILEPRPPGGR